MVERSNLTARDLELLIALTHRVRVLTVSQIARTWWAISGAPEQVATRRLQILRRAKLVQMEHLPAHPELSLKCPVASWKPNETEPDFGSLSYRLTRYTTESRRERSCAWTRRDRR